MSIIDIAIIEIETVNNNCNYNWLKIFPINCQLIAIMVYTQLYTGMPKICQWVVYWSNAQAVQSFLFSIVEWQISTLPNMPCITLRILLRCIPLELGVRPCQALAREKTSQNTSVRTLGLCVVYHIHCALSYKTNISMEIHCNSIWACFPLATVAVYEY